MKLEELDLNKKYVDGRYSVLKVKDKLIDIDIKIFDTKEEAKKWLIM